MLLKVINLKNIRLTIILFLFVNFHINSQKTKIDGVAVVVGKNIVLDSDIRKFKLEVEKRSDGKVKISDCDMLEELMKQKLMAHHAVVDSVVVSQSEIDGKVNRSIQYFTQQYGSKEKVVKAYGFNNLEDLKKELGRVQKENLLIEKEQLNITKKIDVTPEEVRIYYNGLKTKKELPEFPAEVEIAQIVFYAEPTKKENERVISKLKKIKKEIEQGAGFKLKAIINSDDPSVAQNGGKLGMLKKDSPFIKKFKEVAFSLAEGQISEPFKTIFGYHIVLVHKIRGEGREVSHILIQPKVSDKKLKETKELAEKIKNKILKKEITFDDAVKKYSQDKETKNSNGLITNALTSQSTWEITRMPPEIYGRISELKQGELSDVFYDETRGGKKMYKFILVKKKTNNHKADLVEDYVKVQQLALTKKKEETIEKWIKDKIKNTYLKVGNEYKNCNFKLNWKKANN